MIIRIFHSQIFISGLSFQQPGLLTKLACIYAQFQHLQMIHSQRNSIIIFRNQFQVHHYFRSFMAFIIYWTYFFEMFKIQAFFKQIIQNTCISNLQSLQLKLALQYLEPHQTKLMTEPKNNKDNMEEQCQISDSDLSISFEQQQFNRIYTNQLKKKQQKKEKANQKEKNRKNPALLSDSQQDRNQQDRSMSQQKQPQKQDRSRSRSRQKKRNVNWHIYDLCENLTLDRNRFNSYVLNLPIFKKKQEILNNIINNQVVLVTGETGCGKSTQVPRLLYEYIRETGLKAKIICVQPRRLAVKNLHKILSDQIPENGAVGYHIAMQTYIKENTKILFMTNGIFLQRLVHGTQFFNQYPFIILDQVHQRDIDTDFILLSMKRLMRNHPKLRVILMSATIDNKLFQYYFAEDQIENFLKRENYYKRFIRLEEQVAKFRREQQEEDQYRIERVGEQDEMYKKIQMEYLKSKYPCPTVNVTQKGKFKKQYFYLDTLKNFIDRSYCMKWGSVSFIQKSPSTNKQLYETACIILEEIMIKSPRDRSNQSVLIFLPGLGEIQYLASEIKMFFGQRASNFQIVKCHSSILNDQTTKKLHQSYKDKFKVIIATNIAESSITVFGIKYIIDFCLSKQINFNQKSRMENLELVWASKASCQQRAGRTGRVCDGIVFRMVEQGFYRKLPDYSTPQIQRSSLDKLILRIKLIHENQNGKIFEDPGEVLGTAIQPPNLKHIDQAIKSLILCGGLKIQGEKLHLTKLGRIYVDIPLDIIYCKMLVFSLLMGTFEDIIILVCILSQNKNAFRRSAIEKNPLEYFELISNQQRCDFTSLINAYRHKQRKSLQRNRSYGGIQLDIYHETRLLIQDVTRRMRQRNFNRRISPDQSQQDYDEKFKMTICFGFLSNLMRVRPMVYDDKQQKRYKLMKKQGITVHNTVVLLNSDLIRKSPDQNQNADNRLKQNWIQNIAVAFRIKAQNLTMTLGNGLSFLHFKDQLQLTKFLFVKGMDKKRMGSEEKSSGHGRVLSLSQILPHIGDIDFMQLGSPAQVLKDYRVNIDQNSSNNIVPVNKQNQSLQFPVCRLLIANSITQHNSRLSCRFTSLLPDITNLQTILHMVFYPFVTLMPDKKRTRYDSIFLRKRVKLRINYELNDQEINQANQVREIIRDLMNLTLFFEEQASINNVQPVRVIQQGRIIQETQRQPEDKSFMSDKILPTILFEPQKQNKNQKKLARVQEPSQNLQIKYEQTQTTIRNNQRLQKMKKFWPKLKSFIVKQRRPVILQEKWQQLYFKEKGITQNLTNIKHQKDDQKQYMNDIKAFDLRFSYFSSSYESAMNRLQRVKQYQKWKLQRYRQVQSLQALATDHDPYLVCTACQVKVAKLAKVGPINNQYFRELFEHIEENVMKLSYNQLGDYFCSMLMTVYMEKQYQVYGCINGHYLALKFKDQKRLRILTFSPISIIYTDGTVDESPQFEALQYRKWRQRFQQSKTNKMKKPAVQNMCFVCGDKFKTVKQIQNHVKTPYHESNMRDFKSTIAEIKQAKQVQKVNWMGNDY